MEDYPPGGNHRDCRTLVTHEHTWSHVLRGSEAEGDGGGRFVLVH